MNRRLLARADAKKGVDRWIAFMRAQGLTDAIFGFQSVPANQDGAMATGMRIEELRLQGFVVCSHGSSLQGQNEAGEFVMFYTFHVQAPALLVTKL